MAVLSARMLQFHEDDTISMDKERFEVKNVTNTVEIAASRFKMLQIVRNMDRTER